MKFRWRSSKTLLHPGEIAGLTCDIAGLAPREDGMFVVSMSFKTHRAQLNMVMDPLRARELGKNIVDAADAVLCRQMQLNIEAEGGM